MSPRIVIIGDTTRAEFGAIVDFVSSLAGSQSFSTTNAALSDPHLSRADLIVALESHPDEYSLVEIESLFAASPVARVVCCYGQWSESAGRTRKIWPVALRVQAVAAVARLEREWGLITGSDSEFRLPATGNREETFAANHAVLGMNVRKPEAPARDACESSLAGASGFLSAESWKRLPPLPNPLPRGGGEGTKTMTVRVISPDVEYRAMLIDLMRGVGWAVDNDHADAAIWDADPWHVGRAADVRALAETAVVIAVSGWITPQMEAELFGAGARVVVPKLGDQMQLVDAVCEVIASSQATANL